MHRKLFKREFASNLFSFVPPSNSLVVFDPFRDLDSHRALLPELQRYKETVRCGKLGAEVPGQSRTTDVNLDCAFAKNDASLHCSGNGEEWNGLPLRPPASNEC